MQPRTRETTDTMMDMDMTDAAVAVAAVRDMADDATESSSDAGTGTAVLERPETSGRTQRDDGGDADRYAHYVSKNRIAESRLCIYFHLKRITVLKTTQVSAII